MGTLSTVAITVQVADGLVRHLKKVPGRFNNPTPSRKHQKGTRLFNERGSCFEEQKDS